MSRERPAFRNRQDFGQQAEKAAEQYLRRKGYHLVDRNVRLKFGEIDLIVTKDEWVVFVEVKARRKQEFGGALYAMDQQKAHRLSRLAMHYLAHHGWSERLCRFDVILFQGGLFPESMQHIENAFEVP